jgi:hypothetical protein
MDYYVPNSRKMMYKGNFKPAQILCPITYHFVEYTEDVRKLVLENGPDIRLCFDKDLLPEMAFQDEEIDEFIFTTRLYA